MEKKSQCLIENCLSKEYSRGLCVSHYQMISKLVKAGKRTWEEFQHFGMANIKRTKGTYKIELFEKMLAKVSKK